MLVRSGKPVQEILCLGAPTLPLNKDQYLGFDIPNILPATSKSKGQQCIATKISNHLHTFGFLITTS